MLCRLLRTRRHNIVICLFSSTLLWIVLIAAFVVAELGLTVILVHLSTRSLPDPSLR
jgi:hypothetical protein